MSTTPELNLEAFNETTIIKRMRSKRSKEQAPPPTLVLESNIRSPKEDTQAQAPVKEDMQARAETQPPAVEAPPKDEAPKKRGRKIKYPTDEERISARRRQQREYRSRKKDEVERLKAMLLLATQMQHEFQIEADAEAEAEAAKEESSQA